MRFLDGRRMITYFIYIINEKELTRCERNGILFMKGWIIFSDGKRRIKFSRTMLVLSLMLIRTGNSLD